MKKEKRNPRLAVRGSALSAHITRASYICIPEAIWKQIRIKQSTLFSRSSTCEDVTPKISVKLRTASRKLT